jgi:hypothetical protein
MERFPAKDYAEGQAMYCGAKLSCSLQNAHCPSISNSGNWQSVWWKVTQHGCVDTLACVQLLGVGVEIRNCASCRTPPMVHSNCASQLPWKALKVMELHDLQGRVLMRQQWSSASDTGTVDAGHCSTGLYVLSVTVDGHRSVSRLVVR